jgi:hypothetical protein
LPPGCPCASQPPGGARVARDRGGAAKVDDRKLIRADLEDFIVCRKGVKY